MNKYFVKFRARYNIIKDCEVFGSEVKDKSIILCMTCDPYSTIEEWMAAVDRKAQIDLKPDELRDREYFKCTEIYLINKL